MSLPTIPLLLTAVAPLLLLALLVSCLRLPPFIAFLPASILAALLAGLPASSITASIEHGIGDAIGSLAGILCLGALFGTWIAESGAAQRIATTLVDGAGKRGAAFALAATGFIIGLPLFYNVGFVLLVPLIYSSAARLNRNVVVTGLPICAGLSIAHGFLPPHPAPTALVRIFHADMGRTLAFGMVVALPTLILAGPLFSLAVKPTSAIPPPSLAHAPLPEADLPPKALSFAIALLPVLLLSIGSLVSASSQGSVIPVLSLLSSPLVVMLVACTGALLTLGATQPGRLASLLASSESALKDVAPILLVIAGAGALKQVYVDSGLSQHLLHSLASLSMPPLLLGWGVALLIRVAIGSATIAGLTTAGLLAPQVALSHVDPSLMVLAIGAGSLMFSHVNDAGFWIFKQYFGLTIRDTLRIWTVMESLVGLLGLAFTSALSLFL